jgi:hypothetical protein
MVPRQSFPNEVCAVYSSCGRLCIAVVARADGLFQGFEDQLFYDADEDVYYWNRVSGGYTGLYATPEDLMRDVRKRSGFGASAETDS